MHANRECLRSSAFYLNSFVRGYKTEILPSGAKAFVNGKWISASGDRIFEVKDKFTHELLYDVANCDVSEAQMATSAARQAFRQWAFETTAKERGAILHKWYEILMAKEAQFAELLTLEQGKPLSEARGEIQYSASFFDWYAGEARRAYGQVVPAPKLKRQHYHLRQPIGVVAVITPWNFPSAMIARKAAAALAVGCTMLVKPAHETPLSALALAQSGVEAGLPYGVFNVITADHERTAEISKFLCSSEDIDCISFTGSTPVGKLLLTQSASTVKRLCLELGGNAPLIVFESADIEKAVQGAIATKFRCSGQTCVSANRFYVHHTIHDQFVDALKVAVAQLKCGYGMQKQVTQGPLISRKAVEKVSKLLEDALSKGAKLVCGGGVVKIDGVNNEANTSTVFTPTILINVTTECQIAHEEIFGPVIAIQKFKSEEDVLKKANHSRHGLAGYVFSNDYRQIHRITTYLQVGMLGVNEGLISCAEAAFGGVKESGLGREGGAQGVDEFTQWKYVCVDTA